MKDLGHRIAAAAVAAAAASSSSTCAAAAPQLPRPAPLGRPSTEAKSVFRSSGRPCSAIRATTRAVSTAQPFYKLIQSNSIFCLHGPYAIRKIRPVSWGGGLSTRGFTRSIPICTWRSRLFWSDLNWEKADASFFLLAGGLLVGRLEG